MKAITVQEVHALFKTNAITLLDVRGAEEYAQANIAGAILHPLPEISSLTITSDKQPVVIHCHSGKRSEAACHFLKKMFPDIEFMNMSGGIVAWEKAGLPTVSSVD